MPLSSFCISASHFELKLDLAREREFHACVLRERGFALHFFGWGGLRRLINASHSSFCISACYFELKLDLARERVSCLCFERECVVLDFCLGFQYMVS